MKINQLLWSAGVLGFAVLSGASQAQAATDVLNLSGTVASASSYSFKGGNTLYQGAQISLSGLDAFSVSQGDQIDATVTLDQAFNIPASISNTAVFLFLTSSSFLMDPSTVAETGTTMLYDGVTQVFNTNVSNTTSGELSLGGVVFPPNNAAFGFDSGTFNFTITTLDATQSLNSAVLFYQLQSPVPEPETWAMMLLGLGGLGAAMRSRRKSVTA